MVHSMLCVYFITHKIYKYVCVLSHFSHVWLFISGHQAPLSMGFSRQEYWSGLPCPPPGDLPDSEIKPTSLYVYIYRHKPIYIGFLYIYTHIYIYIYTHTFRTQMKEASESLTHQKRKKANSAGVKLFLNSTPYLLANICLMVYARHKSKGWEYSKNSKTRRFHTN